MKTPAYAFQWTVPNSLTLLRLATTPVIVALVLLSTTRPALLQPACGLVLGGGVLDKLDGYFARKLNQASDFGRLWDPIVDKLWLHSIMLAMVSAGVWIHFPVVLLGLARDLIVTELRSISDGDGEFKQAELLGKRKFRSQVAYVVSCFLVAFAGPAELGRLVHAVNYLLAGIVCYYVIRSGIFYTRRYTQPQA